MLDLNRRSLIKGSVAAGVTALFGTAAQASTKVPAKWDETHDVVVIGSGFAGLAAAIEAKKAGADTVVLEKMPTAGGNSIINGGILTATGCPQQLKHGIKDSPELLASDMLAAGLYMNQPEKVKLVAKSALSNYEWTVKELGVEYNLEAIGQEGGHSVPRYVFTKNGSGSGIVTKELEKLKKMGVPVRLRCYVERIFRDDSGRVVGVQNTPPRVSATAEDGMGCTSPPHPFQRRTIFNILHPHMTDCSGSFQNRERNGLVGPQLSRPGESRGGTIINILR